MQTPDHVITINLNTAVDRVIEVPNLDIGAHAKGRQLSRFPAGKAINVSRVLARVNCDSVATGFVGQGESLQFEQFLKNTGPGRIICQLLAVRGQTRENITLIDTIRHTDTHIRDEGFEITDADFHRMMSKLGLLARPNAIMVFSGSIPRGMDVPKLNMLLMMAMSGGAKVVLDTGGDILAQLVGLDPNDLPSPDAPALEPDDNPLWLVKPNRLELAQMMGKKDFENDHEIVQAGLLLAQRVRCVVVTLGPQGAWLFQDKKAWRGTVQIDQNRIVNTVGCGDSMIAGLLEAQICGAKAMMEALSHANRFGRTTGLGTNPDDAHDTNETTDDGKDDDKENDVNLNALHAKTKDTSSDTSRDQAKIHQPYQYDPVNLNAVTRGPMTAQERASEHGPEAFLKRGLAVATANALSAGIAQFEMADVQEIEKTIIVERFEI